jgi:hypothetical protein
MFKTKIIDHSQVQNLIIGLRLRDGILYPELTSLDA